MATWIWLFIVNRVLASLCPFTSKAGAFLGWIEVVAEIVFVALTFFFADKWWYGLIALAIYFLVPVLMPRIDPNNMGTNQRILSGIGATINCVIVVLMYLSLFNVI